MEILLTRTDLIHSLNVRIYEGLSEAGPSF